MQEAIFGGGRDHRRHEDAGDDVGEPLNGRPALAKRYKEQAAQYKKVAEEHKAMAAVYAKSHPDSKGGVKNPWNEKMQKHCKTLATDAEKMAADSEKAADFHTMRAKELQGK